LNAVGVLGGYGAVGRVTVAQLRARRIGPVLVVGRDPARADLVLDVEDAADLERFRLVVNCSGVPPQIRARIARMASAAGVPYVDPGGDEAVHALLSPVPPAVPVVLSAGMWPGLTGLLPRRLAPPPGSRLICYVGGQDRFSLAGAAQYLAAMANENRRTFAVWRGGARVEAADVPALDGDVPYFDEMAGAIPYLSPELERLAADVELAELVSYTVLPGAHLRQTLGSARRGRVDPEAVVRASRLDLFGRLPYQRLVATLPDEPGAPTIILTGAGSADLTGGMAARTAVTILEGGVRPGLHYAADVLDPVRAIDAMRTSSTVTQLRLVQAGAHALPLEEGTL
jgi:hypothetical protein